MTGLAAPEPLAKHHDVERFDCGDAALNAWLVDHAWPAQRAGTARTYVTHRARVVRGYYSLAAGSVVPRDVPQRVSAGGGRHPVPIVVLARLAVDRDEQGAGVGTSLVRDALFRIAGAADIVGVRAVLVHVKHPDLAAFYERFDFEPGPVDQHQMFLLMKDLRRALET